MPLLADTLTQVVSMGEPTVYKTPRKSLPGNKPSAKDVHKWEKHRDNKGKTTKPPKTKK